MAVALRDFLLRSHGIAVKGLDRFDVSVTQDQFDHAGTALDGLTVRCGLKGFKYRAVLIDGFERHLESPQRAQML